MADLKRKLPPKVAAMKAKKRQRVHGNPETQPAPGKRQKSGSRVAVNLDKLYWKSVPLNSKLEDAEGLCGLLEEISDVEVTRDEETGRVAFRALPGAEVVGSHYETNVDEGDGEDAESWEGFADEDSKPSAPISNGTTKKQPGTKAPPNGKKAKDVTSNKPKNEESDHVFAGLQGTDDSLEGVDTSAWEPLNLSPDIRAALSKLKFSQPTPIQLSAIPEILEGKDVIGKASTGSGKTLAFGIPILQQFLENKADRSSSKRAKAPVALILSPTRELAHQLDKHLTALCSSVLSGGPSIATVTGGLSVQKQQRLLKYADIVIGTPGRLWEVISAGEEAGKAIRQVQYLVVDEADRLLSEGHFKEVEEILNYLDRQDNNDEADIADKPITKSSPSAPKPTRQTLVFSATFDRGLQRKLATKSNPKSSTLANNNKDSLASLLTKLNFQHGEPSFIDVNPINQLAAGLTEELVQCEGTEKDLYLYTLLFSRPAHRTLVFANSIDAVRRLTPMLQNLGLAALALHSEMAQKARLRSVERFTLTKAAGAAGSILVATDVAARGLDIPNVQTVIHYHLPRTADTYVHRSGRTARAGLKGSSIIICEAREVAGVRRLIAKVHAKASSTPQEGAGGNYIRTLDPERRLISQLKPRLKLAKRLADAGMAKQRQGKEDETMRIAAEELGQEYDSEEFEAQGARGRQGRGRERKKKQKEDSGLTKGEMGAMKAELRGLLQGRVNTGWSPRYLTAGGVDVEGLLREKKAREEGV